jgi:hypothetical protein
LRKVVLDSPLTDGGEVVSLTPLPPLPTGRFLVLLSVGGRPQGRSAAERIRSIEKPSDLIRNRTRDLLACSIVPQPTTLPHAPDCCLLAGISSFSPSFENNLSV